MSLQMKARLGLICLMTLFVLAACGQATPTAAPTPSLAPTEQPTSTLSPTETTPPTETPAQPAANETPAAPNTTSQPGTDAGAPPASVTATQAPAANPPSGGTVFDKYQYLGQNVADRSQFLPNRSVTITWTVKNIGTNGWSKDYALRYFSGPKPPKEVYTFDKEVPAGGSINFTVTFTTPSELGTYDLWFKLTNNEGKNFGDLDLVFTVSNSPVSATSTPAK